MARTRRSQPGAARLVRRHRRMLAGAAAGASIAALGLALQPPPPPTRAVVVAAADMPTGRRLVATDLAVAQVPAGVLPAGSGAEPSTFLGQVLAAPMARGEPLAGHRLTSQPRWAMPAGTFPMPLRFADPGATALLAAGQRVDILAAAGPGLEGGEPFASAEIVASDVLVLGVLADERSDSDSGVLGGPATSGGSSPLVVLAADRGTALSIAGAQGRSSLSFLMRPGSGG